MLHASRLAVVKLLARINRRSTGRCARLLGFEPLERREVFSASVLASAAKTPPPPVCTSYPREDGIQSRLQTLASAYPTLASVSSIGTLPSGRDIWVMRITDNVASDEPDEPSVSFTATVHGNEPDGVTLSLDLIEELLGKYGSDSRITELVNSTDLWITPAVNADGLEACSRANAQGFDLNRSFPDLSADATQATNRLSSPLTSGQLAAIAVNTPETALMMQWETQHHFVLAADFHENGGAAVVNYPYDKMSGVKAGAVAKSPDDDLFQYIAKVYSSHDHQMWDAASRKAQFGVPFVDGSGQQVSALTVNGTFPYGITNGSDWFTAGGTFEDWQYRYLGTNTVIVEVRDNADFATSDELWAANRDSMLAYLQTVHLGVKGAVLDASGNSPLAATISVVGTGTDATGAPISVNQHFVFSDGADGSFVRMLRPGNYPNLSIRISAPGYVDAVFSRSVSIANPQNNSVPPGPLPVLPTLVDLGTIRLTRSVAAPAPLSALAPLTATAPRNALVGPTASNALLSDRAATASAVQPAAVVSTNSSAVDVATDVLARTSTSQTSALGRDLATDLVFAADLFSDDLSTV